MSPKLKSKTNKIRPRKNNVPKVRKIALKTSSPIKTRSKRHSMLKTPKSEKKFEPIPSTSSIADPSYKSSPSIKSSEAKTNSIKDDILITPKVMKYCLNAYKQSPEYENLKKRRFNTGFQYESPRGYRDIQIFTPEEENSPKWSENMPIIKNTIEGEPGEKYANIFMSIPGLNISESDEDIIPVEVEETKGKCAAKKGRKGKKKSIGYQGIPFPDDCLHIDYTCVLNSP